ncbi:MAG: hypothetical protein V3U29_06525 [Phycisphaeraceae bacterium]
MAGGVLACALATLLAPAQGLATSTGLNNIPTADTPGHRQIVFQGFVNLTDEKQADLFIGFKTGLQFSEHRFEFGADGRLGEGEPSAVVFQAKYAIQPWEDLPAFAIGAANIAVTPTDRDKVGQAFKFGVISHDFGWFRAHAGYGLQQNNNAAFFGLDKTIQVFERDMMLRFDLIQIDDEEQWLGSAGFIYFLHKHVAVESWISQPFEHGEPTFTLKLNLIFEF